MNYSNKKKKIVSKLKKECKVYLLIKNLKIWKKSKKLNYVKVEIFFIKVKKKVIKYKLKLAKKSKIWLIFYMLVLKLVNSKIPIQDKFYYHI